MHAVHDTHSDKQWTIRPPVLEDAPAVTGLINLCAVLHTGSFQMTVEQLRGIWTSPGFDLNADAWLLFAEDGALAGYAELWCYPADEALPYVWLHIPPGPDAEAIGAALLRHAEARVRHLARVCRQRPALRSATVSFDRAAHRLLAHEGFRLAAQRWETSPAHGTALAPHVAGCIVCRAYIPVDAAWQAWRYDIFEKDLLAEAI